MGILQWLGFSKKTTAEEDETAEANLLIYGYSVLTHLLAAVQDKDIKRVKNFLRRGRTVKPGDSGLRYFTRDLSRRHKTFLEDLPHFEPKIDPKTMNIYVSKLVVLLNPGRGTIAKIVGKKSINWDVLKEKVDEAIKTVQAATAEENKIQGSTRRKVA